MSKYDWRQNTHIVTYSFFKYMACHNFYNMYNFVVNDKPLTSLNARENVPMRKHAHEKMFSLGENFRENVP